MLRAESDGWPLQTCLEGFSRVLPLPYQFGSDTQAALAGFRTDLHWDLLSPFSCGKLFLMKLSDLFSNYFTVRAELVKAVQDLTQEQLDWTPPNHLASIGKLLAHIAECEYAWITCLALKKEASPDFTRFEKARTLREILALLDQYHTEFTEYLSAEDIEDWDRIFYQFPESTEKVSKRWLVWHVVEHQARHRGQIFMLMRMQGIEVPNV